MKILHKSPGKGGRGGGGGGKGEGERGEGGIKYCQTFSPAKSINHLQSANFIFAQIISGRKQRCPCPAQPPQLKRQSHNGQRIEMLKRHIVDKYIKKSFIFHHRHMNL